MHSNNHRYFFILLKYTDLFLCIFFYISMKWFQLGAGTWIRWYGIDLIGGYLFTYVMSIYHQLYFGKKLSFKWAFCLTMLASFYWEYITPMFNPNSISDPFDVIAYLSGFMIYILFHYKKGFYFIKDIICPF